MISARLKYAATAQCNPSASEDAAHTPLRRNVLHAFKELPREADAHGANPGPLLQRAASTHSGGAPLAGEQRPFAEVLASSLLQPK